MKIDGKIQVPNLIVYAVLYAIVFGVSIWLLVFHKDNPTNSYLYVLMIVSVVTGLVKFALNSRRQHKRAA
jgi:DMSO reductase anchor subunit